MRAFPLLVCAFLISLWVFALTAYAELPERIPIHFGPGGQPDGFADRSSWFVLAGLFTLFVALIGLGLPPFVLRLAATNSRWLNVPDKKRFHALSTEQRLRAVAPVVVMLQLLAIAMMALFAVLLHGTQRVAVGAWDRLPEVPLFLLVGAILVVAFGGCLWSLRTVRRVAAETPTDGS